MPPENTGAPGSYQYDAIRIQEQPCGQAWTCTAARTIVNSPSTWRQNSLGDLRVAELSCLKLKNIWRNARTARTVQREARNMDLKLSIRYLAS